MDRATILTTSLSDLIINLRLAGYRVGTTQLIAVQDLILALVAQGQLPTNFHTLTTLLGPLLCHSLEEQQAFPRHFDDWLTQVEIQHESQTQSIADDHPIYSEEENIQSSPIHKQVSLGKWLVLIVIAIIIVITTMVVSQSNNMSFTNNRLFNVIKNQFPDVNYEDIRKYLWFQQDYKEIDSQKVNIKTPNILFSKIGYQQSLVPKSSAKPNLTKTISAIFLLLLLILFIWKIRWWYRKQAFLAQEVNFTTPNIKKLSIKQVETDIFRFASLPKIAQKLRKHISIPTRQLDVKATLLQTLRLGGWFTPIKRTTKQMPTYLALINQITFKDHQTCFIDTLLDQLTAQGVLINRYYFSQDPRRCYSEPAPFQPVILTELAYHHQNDYLLIFSGEESLIDCATGAVVSWIESFSVWPQRYLLTLAPLTHWGSLLKETGFFVLPMDETGLTTLTEQIENQNMLADLLLTTEFKLPNSLHERPYRWLQRHPPDAATLTNLLKEIHTFLGQEGYYWFSACAVYPELHWPLTLYLGTHLTTPDGHQLLTYQQLVKLICLPWFRHGHIPNWLRERLLIDLAIPQENKIRIQLQAFLQEVALDKELSSHFYLEVGNKSHTWLSTIRRWMRSFQRQSISKPAKDQVFVTFMANKLAVTLPHTLYRLLIQADSPQEPNETAQLPSVLGLIWSIFMQPATLHHRLKACGITIPNAPLLTVWQAPGENQWIKRQYVLRLLVVLLVTPILLLLPEMTTTSWTQLLVSLLFLEWMSLMVGISISLIAGLILGLTAGIATSTVIWIIFSITGGNLTILARELNGLISAIDIRYLLIICCIFYTSIIKFTEANILFSLFLTFITYLVGIGLAIISILAMSESGIIVLSGTEIIVVTLVSGLLIQMLMKMFFGVTIGLYTDHHELANTTLLIIITVIIGFPLTIAFLGYHDMFKFIVAEVFISTLIYLISRITWFMKILHTLIYPFEASWQTTCYLVQYYFNYPTLRFASILYHDFSYFPYPLLGQHLALNANTDPKLVKRILKACSNTSGQEYLGQSTLSQLQAQEIIAQLQQRQFANIVNFQGEWLPLAEDIKLSTLSSSLFALRRLAHHLLHVTDLTATDDERLQHLARAEALFFELTGHLSQMDSPFVYRADFTFSPVDQAMKTTLPTWKTVIAKLRTEIMP
jgi:hypothetical protein